MVEEEPSSSEEAEGGGWIMTFADLMSLLMCFFVLLLSFSEMDVLKFKRLAGSMRQAFGVQQRLDVTNVPKGTSIIAQEFSPGRPDPTPLQEIWQKTSDITRNSLEVQCQDLGSSNAGEKGDAQRLIVVDQMADLVGETEQDAIDVATALSQEIAAGVLEVETAGRRIIIRIKENGNFASGSAAVQKQFEPVMKIIRDTLVDTEGQIFVEGHSDNQPIRTRQFRSNWALSSARAVNVAHGLFSNGLLDEERFTVTGYGENRPLVSNSTRAGRSRNRRVEVVVDQGVPPPLLEGLEVLEDKDPVGARQVKEVIRKTFDLSPDEIF